LFDNNLVTYYTSLHIFTNTRHYYYSFHVALWHQSRLTAPIKYHQHHNTLTAATVKTESTT